MSAKSAGLCIFAKRICAVWVLAALLVALVPMAPAPAVAIGVPTTYWVDDDGADSNPGTDTEPFKTITHGLSMSLPGDTVMVKPGTYDEANGESFPLVVSGESLIGTNGAARTSIEGTSTTQCMVGQSFLGGEEIRGFTMRGGGNGPGAGLILSLNSEAANTPTVADNVFQDIDCGGFYGGAMYIWSSVSTGYSKPRIEGNTFSGNFAYDGGAIYVGNKVGARIVENTFSDNEAERYGGAIELYGNGGETVIDGNTFTENAADYGGAVHADRDGAQTISSNTFAGNTATVTGGALWLYRATFVVAGNDAGGNSAGVGGGFGYLAGGGVTSTNNAIGGSGASGDGVAWRVNDGLFREYNDTIADSHDGASAVHAETAADAEVANCILWNPLLAADIYGVDAVSYSDVHDAEVAAKNVSVGPGLIFDAPKFADAAAHTPDLAAASPCIDAADNALAPATDFYGVARPIDGDGNGTAIADIGCCERKLGTALTFSAPSISTYGSARVTGTLKTSAGTALQSQPVRIEYSYNNFVTVAGSKTVNTTSSGAFSWTVAPTRKTYYRAQFKGDATRLASNRITRTVLPKVYLTKPSAKSTQAYRKSYTFRGYLKPRHTAGTKPVRIKAYRYSRGKYRYKKTYYAKAYNYSNYTKYSVKIKLPSRGKWRLRAYHPADLLNAATYSGYKYVRVR